MRITLANWSSSAAVLELGRARDALANTDKDGFTFRTMGVANNALVCPAVFWIVERNEATGVGLTDYPLIFFHLGDESSFTVLVQRFLSIHTLIKTRVGTRRNSRR